MSKSQMSDNIIVKFILQKIFYNKKFIKPGFAHITKFCIQRKA